MAVSICAGCGSAEVSRFFRAENVPVFCNVLWPTREEALAAPRAEIDLACCGGCGLIWNTAYDPSLVEYRARYENSLHFSPRFQQYARGLARRLIDGYHLEGARVVEIGCGQGDFLRMLAQEGCRCVGFDPSYAPKAEGRGENAPGMRIVRDYYGPQHAGEAADLVCSRHVLEHIARPLEFLAMVRRSLEPGEDSRGEPGGEASIAGGGVPVFFVEVPNAMATLVDLAVWDVIYEHCCYFTAVSLRELLERAGFEVLRVSEEFDGQFLAAEARPRRGGSVCGPDPAAVEEVMRLCGKFEMSYQEKVSNWRAQLREMSSRDRCAAAWGAGSKGVTFLNVLAPDSSVVETVVDLNPRKQGLFVPGVALQVMAPEELQSTRPDVVVVMNRVYAEEVRAMLSGLGVAAELVVA
mgnify:CR=1 FL=1